jgi:hypothetical protein
MEVVISEGAQAYIQAHGGTVFVRAHRHRCCGGPLTLLDLSTEPPKDAANFASALSDHIDFRFCDSSMGRPNQLVIELGGLVKKRPIAYWDGCTFKL